MVIIIYSQHIDNAPTKTLQDIIHSARGDVAVPQIVQTTGQSPEPHKSMSEGRKKTSFAPLRSYFKDIPTRDQVHPYWPDSSGQEDSGLGHLNLQLLQATALGQQPRSMSNYLYSLSHQCTFPNPFATATHPVSHI